MTKSVAQVHIAGPTLEYNGVRRQRCGWCGALIQEIDLTTVSRPLEPGETYDDVEPWEPAAWKLGDEVAIEGTFPRTSWLVERPGSRTTSLARMRTLA